MRARALAVCAFVASFVLWGCGKRRHRPPPAVGAAAVSTQRDAPSPGARPSWLPAYGPEQRAILDSSRGMAVEQPALEVYPDVERFAYAKQQPFDPARAGRAASVVEETVRRSERMYVIGRADERLANLVAQYGPAPPPEPDRWVRAVRAEGGRYRLEWATPTREARTYVDAGNRALASGQLAEAAKSFEQAARLSPKAPALRVALAEVHAARGDDAGAEHALHEALAIDGRHPDAHRMLAEIFERRGDLERARDAAARALALYPSSPRAWDVAERLGPLHPRPAPPVIFLEVGASGAIHVGVGATPWSRTYGACRAVVRYEPRVRAQMLGFPKGVPYHLSAGEELFCIEAMLGAYVRGRSAETAPAPGAGERPGKPVEGQPATDPTAPRRLVQAGQDTTTSPSAPAASPVPPPPGSAGAAAAAAPSPEPPPTSSPPEPRLDDLVEIARAGDLGAYVMFEIVGQHRPEWLRVAPDDLHESVVRYVQRRVLSPR